jgi:isopenicillin-N epimerase
VGKISSDGLVPEPVVSPSLWFLDPQVDFLNHGSFGACPREVLEFQWELRQRLERQPVRFLARELEGLLDEARAGLAAFVGADAGDLAFVANATTGLNTVLRSLEFQAGDELLVTDHEYNASRNALEFAAGQARARVVVAPVPFPVRSADEIIECIRAGITQRTKLALLDHVTSQTGLVLPLERIVPELEERGIRCLIDGAHAPGMIPLNLTRLGASYYTGNCHKWICAPKGAAFLYVRPDCQPGIRPLVISHGANSPRKDRSRFQIEFGWMGTSDPTAALSVPRALRFMEGLMPGGWPAIMQHNRELAIAGRALLCDALKVDAPAPEALLGSLAAVPLPPGRESGAPSSPLYADPLQDELLRSHSIEVPIIPWPAPPRRVIRISAQLYNALPQYGRLAEALPPLLQAELRQVPTGW